MVTIKAMDMSMVRVDYIDVTSKKAVFRELTKILPGKGDGVYLVEDGVTRFWKIVEMIWVIDDRMDYKVLSVGMREVDQEGGFK